MPFAIAFFIALYDLIILREDKVDALQYINVFVVADKAIPFCSSMQVTVSC
jgi:hypothetical protein